jgi:ABC-2 type transport system permease protein
VSAGTAFEQASRASLLGAELWKLPAFLRRDFLVAWSYRMAFFSDILALFTQALLFALVGLMIEPNVLPEYGGTRATYMEFVAIGLTVGVFLGIGLTRVMSTMRAEQVQGTLEALMITPTSFWTIQLGSAVYDLFYVPVRTAVFLGIITLLFGTDFEPSGILPATLLLLLFIPIVWGLAIAAAAGTLTFKRGAGGVAFGATILTIGSGAYVPLSLMPDWVQTVAEVNPLAIVLEGMRDALLGGTGWSGIAHDVALLAPMAAASLAFGAFAFRLALRREKRRGSLGLY